MPDDPATSPDLVAIKGRQQQTWGAGDYNRISSIIVLTSELLCEAIDLQAGERALDVAGGTGNASLAASRRFGNVTCTDYVPALLERARLRADAEGLTVNIQEADAENLPFPDASYDVVLSTFGVMFTLNQHKAASELVRVCRSGGRVGLTAWTPDGFIGELFRTTGRHVPPPPGLASVFTWGTEGGLRELLGDSIRELRTTERQHLFRFQSPQHFVEHFRSYYGPTQKAFDSLDEDGRQQLADDIMDLVQRSSGASSDAVSWPADYLEVVAVRA